MTYPCSIYLHFSYYQLKFLVISTFKYMKYKQYIDINYFFIVINDDEFMEKRKNERKKQN